ncbi:MAG: endonuclease domain-containing protein [Pseudomonadota bacterium]|nr:endonuclease domain-containing protein [Pseudomonadota bacterium]
MDKAYDRVPTLRSRDLRNNATDAERKLWNALRSRQINGVRFNRQVPIGPFICDFVARGPKLVIEVDGGQHAIAAAADARRTRFLEDRGYRVIRFWNNEVLDNIEGVVEAILLALADRPSPSALRASSPPAPAGGE